jgi:hypothetical protein
VTDPNDLYQGFMKVFFGLVLSALTLATSSPVGSQPIDPSCAEVAKAIVRLRDQHWALVHGTVTQGKHPELYTTMTSALLGRRQQIRILDGERFSGSVDGYDKDTLNSVIGAGELHPDTPCVRIMHNAPPHNGALIEYSYSAKVTRADAHLNLWISPTSGLPVKVQIDGPQLLYRRSLSRPGKPPQVMLWPNGLRYIETKEYVFGEAQVNQWLADSRIKNP